MEQKYYDNRELSPEKAQRILAKNGVEVSLEDARKTLELLMFLVNLSVDQILDQE